MNHDYSSATTSYSVEKSPNIVQFDLKRDLALKSVKHQVSMLGSIIKPLILELSDGSQQDTVYKLSQVKWHHITEMSVCLWQLADQLICQWSASGVCASVEKMPVSQYAVSDLLKSCFDRLYELHERIGVSFTATVSSSEHLTTDLDKLFDEMLLLALALMELSQQKISLRQIHRYLSDSVSAVAICLEQFDSVMQVPTIKRLKQPPTPERILNTLSLANSTLKQLNPEASGLLAFHSNKPNAYWPEIYLWVRLLRADIFHLKGDLPRVLPFSDYSVKPMSCREIGKAVHTLTVQLNVLSYTLY